jgi:glycosyltransferase involved in cell wall biosynthesis
MIVMLAGSPLLTIGIPTYNRAHLLYSLLEIICPQIASVPDSIEVIISDNCSSDNTRDVSAAFSKRYGFVHYHRNDVNVGFNGNLKVIAVELAKGKYCWLIGDDDVVSNHGIRNICEALADNRGIECFFVNYGLVSNMGGTTHQIGSRLALDIEKDIVVDRWEKILLLPAKNSLAIFCGFFSQIMLTKLWVEQFSVSKRCEHEDDVNQAYPCLNCSFPFIKMFAKAACGKPAYVIAKPSIYQGMGTQDYLQYSSLHGIILYYKFIDFFAALGIDEMIINALKVIYYRNFGGFFIKYCEEKRFSAEMEQIFQDHFIKLSSDKEFWRAIKSSIQEGDRDSGFVKQYYRRSVINQMLKDMLNDEQGLVVWGYGELGSQIVDGLDELKEKLIAVIDIDGAKQGRKVPRTNVCIGLPESLRSMKNVGIILVASLAHEAAIIDTICNDLQLDTTIISAVGVKRSRAIV